ncbi:Leucyl-tRNA synthetase [Metamycoplasma alkalescens 14918]|uniref:Leucine--tRNA ligase n=2 Tax=Metamycoplasma alkalescens TaxID=45363 RepID=N9U004_9BACT|nr:leucine--tRNA ligase [Metamycoplasma alkalescens]ENY53877.1 Leucyl-tRNA synthetase [Metamycoplasma alkalescens 14918]
MYNHKLIEKKWQKFWEDNKSFKTTNKSNKKAYILDMFPYPSGSGLHVGHLEGYTATDIIARYKRLKGFDVLHPIGWDAFGLPAEQYALKTGNHPATFTIKNIDNFRKQLKLMGFSYDYDKEINTTDPKFYYWTQWIFKELYKKGLASIEEIDVNWCEQLGTVLANEEIIDLNGKKVSERGNYPVVRKPMKQWVLKITEYAEKLLEELDNLDWPESLKLLQKNWIGKSKGHVVEWGIKNHSGTLETFTTRLDTIYGVSALIISPEHPLLLEICDQSLKNQIEKYIATTKEKNDLERTQLNKEKTGLFIGTYAIHPLTKQKIPIWVSDYVLMNYGSGALMLVPAHDSRDFEFAKKFNLEIKVVLEANELPFLNDAAHCNSGFANGLGIKEAKKVIYQELIKLNRVKEKTNFKLRDWIFSRQRYWGEPFPVLFDEHNQIHLVENLVKLPEIDNIKPSNSTQGPLANIKSWINVEIDGKKYAHDTNVMPQWAGSSWYFLAYILKNEDGSYLALNSDEAKKRFEKWMPVDLYIGGQEHAVLHLLYARFWHRFLYDIGIVNTKEPFYKIINQGLVLGPDNQKMSKSLGNVINPDELVSEFGADALRLYEMFMGPITDSKAWNTDSLNGIRKWLDRIDLVFNNLLKNINPNSKNSELDSQINQLILDITNNIEKYKFNIAISKLMVFINYLSTLKEINSTNIIRNFGILLSPFAPHFAEEILFNINEKSLQYQSWPIVNLDKIINKNPQIGIQINGKIRAQMEIIASWNEKEIVIQAISLPSVKKWIEDKQIIKTIYVENKILNIIVK